MAEEFYLKATENAPETGPFSSKKMRQLAAVGQISPETLVRRGDSSWVAASSVRGLEFTSAAPPVSTSTATDAPVPMGIPVTPTDGVPTAKPTKGADLQGISLAPRVTDPTGATGEAQIQAPSGEPHPFDEAAPNPPSIIAPPPPPPRAPTVAAPVVEAKEKPKPAAQEISEMISVTPSDKAEGKGKKKKGKQPPVRTSSGEKKSGGGIGALFSFETMIAPSVAKVVYYVWLLLILFSWLGGAFSFLGIGLMAADGTAAMVATLVTFAGLFIGGGVIALLYILGMRIMIEVVIAFFRAADDLAAIRAQNEEKS